MLTTDRSLSRVELTLPNPDLKRPCTDTPLESPLEGTVLLGDFDLMTTTEDPPGLRCPKESEGRLDRTDDSMTWKDVVVDTASVVLPQGSGG